MHGSRTLCRMTLRQDVRCRRKSQEHSQISEHLFFYFDFCQHRIVLCTKLGVDLRCSTWWILLIWRDTGTANCSEKPTIKVLFTLLCQKRFNNGHHVYQGIYFVVILAQKITALLFLTNYSVRRNVYSASCQVRLVVVHPQCIAVQLAIIQLPCVLLTHSMRFIC